MNHFVKKLEDLGSLPKNAILCTTDVIGLYSNIPHEERLPSSRKHLDKREIKEMTTDTWVKLADIHVFFILRSTFFKAGWKFLSIPAVWAYNASLMFRIGFYHQNRNVLCYASSCFDAFFERLFDLSKFFFTDS